MEVTDTDTPVDSTLDDTETRFTEAEWNDRNRSRNVTWADRETPFTPDNGDSTAEVVDNFIYDEDYPERNPWRNSIIRDPAKGTEEVLVWNDKTGTTFRCATLDDANLTIRDNGY